VQNGKGSDLDERVQAMVKLKANFESDLIAHARRNLTARWGPKIERIKDRDILIYFFDSLRRQIATRPRDIKIADDFKCPSARENNWKTLQQKVRRGEDLNIHLSERHASLFHRDGLLNEWGAHHFHLGIKPQPKKPNYVKRSDPLVFALVTESTFYAINFYKHDEFEKFSIIESLHRNWPDAISKYRLRGVHGEELDEKQRKNIRKQSLQTAVTTSDGTVYGPIGGGVTSAGTSVQSVFNAAKWTDEIRRLQSALEGQLYMIMPALERGGYSGEQDVEAELRITADGYQSFFPRYNVLANLAVS
jgi:hypothetical protein